MKKRPAHVTSRIMAAVRRKDTKPELIVRRRLWRLGMRYRVDFGQLTGRPDIAFTRARVAVFIDGDFWHGNAWKVREKDSLSDLFPTNTEWWVDKIEGTRERDRTVNRALREQGWLVLRYWESEVLGHPDGVVEAIVRAVRRRLEEPVNERP
jgi:DNA mismatch endonuclease, patch repair protein